MPYDNMTIIGTHQVLVFHPTFNHPWRYFVTSCWHEKVGRLANGWTHPSSMPIIFSKSVIWKVTVVTSNTIWQYGNYCHSQSTSLSSKFQSSMTIFYHKLLTREGRGFNQWMNSSIVHANIIFIRSVIRKVTIVTSNTIWQHGNYCHSPNSSFWSKFWSSMMIYYHKLLTREGRGFGQWMNSSIIHANYIFIRSVIRKVTLVTSNTILWHCRTHS